MLLVPVPPILSAALVIFGLTKAISSASSKACGKGCVPATSMKLPISIFAIASGGIAETSTDRSPIVRIPRPDAMFSTWPATKTGVAPDTYGEAETVTKAAFWGKKGFETRSNQTARDKGACARCPCQFPCHLKQRLLRINQIRLSKDCDLDQIGDTFSTGPATNAVCADAAATKAQPSNAKGYLFAFFMFVVSCLGTIPGGWSALHKIRQNCDLRHKTSAKLFVKSKANRTFCRFSHKKLQQLFRLWRDFFAHGE